MHPCFCRGCALAQLFCVSPNIVGELRLRAHFKKTVLLIDSFEGPYLRQYTEANLPMLLSVAEHLHQLDMVDEIWIAPTNINLISQTSQRWFAEPDITTTHSVQGAPVLPQLWAFDCVETSFVLQMDVDVLIGGTDANHDVVADMKRACSEPRVWCVGFNIAQSSTDFKEYTGEPDQFPPEIRCGLLNLDRIKANRPFKNPVVDGQLTWMWHQALRNAQPATGMRSLRGGDSRTFYVHPRNEDKCSSLIDRVRDLIGQARIPDEQHNAWNLVSSASWNYVHRHEDIVFLLFGRDTPLNKLERCLTSLKSQLDQNFGVIFIDDGGNSFSLPELPYRLRWLENRLTLIRRPYHVGYMKNFKESIVNICTRPETLLVILDQDDALMHTETVSRLREAWLSGADIINAPMFRPDKPLMLYEVNYDSPRQRGGGNVWSHLRAFRKCLFEKVPIQAWEKTPSGIDCLSDFITMVPMAELAQHPIFLDGPYLYWHERLPYSTMRKKEELVVKKWLFSQPTLISQSVV